MTFSWLETILAASVICVSVWISGLGGHCDKRLQSFSISGGLYCANHRASVCGARPHPAAGRMPSRAARLCEPRSQRLRRRRFAPSTRPWRARAQLVSLTHSFSPLGMERGMLARPRLRRSWLRRQPPQEPPLRHAGLTALPWPLTRPASRPSALAAQQHPCPARFLVLCHSSSVHSPLRTCNSALYQALSALPANIQHLKPWVMLYSLHGCYIALIPVLYSWSMCFIAGCYIAPGICMCHIA